MKKRLCAVTLSVCAWSCGSVGPAGEVDVGSGGSGGANSGGALVYVWNGAGASPSCPGDSLPVWDGKAEFAAGAAHCGPCECEEPTSEGFCRPPDSATPLAISESCNSSMEAKPVHATWDDSCVPMPSPVGSVVVYLTARGSISEASSAPLGGEPSIEPPSWGANVRACSERATTTGWRECVMHEGQHACDVDRPNRVLAFTGFADTRSCTACECDYKDKCRSVVEAYESADCSGAPVAVAKNEVPYDDPLICGMQPVQAIAALRSRLEYLEPSPDDRYRFIVSGGTVAGVARPVGDTTFCCAD